MEARRPPARLAVHIQSLEHRGRPLRRQLARVVGQLAQLVHLLRGQQQIGIRPAFHPLGRTHAHQPPPDFKNIQTVAMLHFRHARRFRRQLLPQVHADGADVGCPDDRHLGSARFLRFAGDDGQ